MHLLILGFGAVVVYAVFLISRLIAIRHYPDAPGPTAAKYTHLWYLWKVWQGKFEKWNIEEHHQNGNDHTFQA